MAQLPHRARQSGDMPDSEVPDSKVPSSEQLDSDESLMRRLAQRDAQALALLAEKYANVPWRIACRMLDDTSEAEDIAQESMLRLWNMQGDWDAGGAGVAAWLTRVATNLCIDRIRRRRKISDDTPADRIDQSPLADAHAENNEMRAMIIDCIQKLPERQRGAIILTYYEEQPNRDAATAMSMKIKAFESILLRARLSLRRCAESMGIRGVMA